MNSKTDSLCDFCLKSKSKYCCPRCHRKYCSMDCFRSGQHIQCSEQFFKQCVTEELLSQRFDDSSKHKILEILKRNNNQLFNDLVSNEDNEDIGGEDDETDQSFESRFSELDLSDWRHLWNKLSDNERQEFNQLLKSGRIGEFVDLWNPWWKTYTNRSNHSLVTPLDETPNEEIVEKEDNFSEIPELMSNIMDLKKLISKPPALSVCPTVVNCLLSYCYVCRLFNGEYESIESIQKFIEKCPQISNHINCDDLSQSLQMSVQQIMTEQPSLMAIELLFDLKCLIEGPKLRTNTGKQIPEYVLRALSDLICVFSKVKKKCLKQKQKELKLMSKKLEFFLSWALSEGMVLFECIPQIQLIIDSLQLSLESNECQEIGEELRTKLRPKTLIEEIN